MRKSVIRGQGKSTNRRLVGRACQVGVATLVALTLGAGQAWAALAPVAGPTSGGTVVSGEAPGFDLDSFSVGVSHMTGRGMDGTYYSWGSNERGQLGNGVTSYTDTLIPAPVQVPAGVEFTSMTALSYKTIAQTSDGTFYAWGQNSFYGALGVGDSVDHTVPARVLPPDGVTYTSVSLGEDFGVALGDDGNTYAWGNNSDGQLGVGSGVTMSLTPVKVPLPDGVTLTQVFAEHMRVVAVGSDGLVYTWGSNYYGELGNGTHQNQYTPVPVSAPEGVTFTGIATVSAFTAFAWGSDGNLYGWGRNAGGQFGDGTTVDHLTPVRVQPPKGVTYTAVSAGTNHMVALGSDGNTYAWGEGWYGQLGNGGYRADSLTPVQVSMPEGVTFTRIQANGLYTFAWGSDGTTYAWGSNDYDGQLGVGDHVDRTVPTQAPRFDVQVTGVRFGDLPGTEVVADGKTWTATAPAHGCGVVDVTLEYTLLGTNHVQTFTDGFTYGTAPEVSLQPTNQAVAGGEVTLTAAADGDDAPTVQWQRASTADGPWVDIDGANEPSVTTAAAETGFYQAEFSNCLGTVTTDAAAIGAVTNTDRPAINVIGPPVDQPTTPVTVPTANAGVPTQEATEAIGAAGATGTLPWTGAEAFWSGAIALVLLAGGALVLAVKRRGVHQD